jgi:hypothetical protein
VRAVAGQPSTGTGGCERPGYPQVVRILRLALVIALVLAAVATADAQSPARAAAPLAPATFEILSTKTGKLVGHGRYTVEQVLGRTIIRGVNRYLDGEYDVEKDEIAIIKGRTAPVLVECRHSFFYPDGQLKRESHADIRSGFASCIQRSRSGKEWVKSDELRFPADTYAGASLLLRLQDFLKANGRGRTVLGLHDFDCVPSPKVIAVQASVEPGEKRWAHYPAAQLVAVKLEPDFGFFTFLVRPFIPRVTAWFDPSEEWGFVGGDLQRYYRGPLITLVKAPVPAPRAESAAPPVQRTP